MRTGDFGSDGHSGVEDVWSTSSVLLSVYYLRVVCEGLNL